MALDSPSTQLYDARNSPISALDHDVETALGNITGHHIQRKFGFNPALNTSTFETIVPWGGRIDILETAETISFVSTDAEDGAGTLTGALTIRIEGVGAGFVATEETLTLTGLVPAVTDNSYLMVNRIRVLTAGSVRTNVGVITRTASGASSIQAQIPAGYSTSQQVFFMVPTGLTMVLRTINITATRIAAGQQPLVTVRIYQHDYGSAEFAGTSAIIFQDTFDTFVAPETPGSSLIGGAFGAGTVLEVTALSDLSDTEVDGHLTMYHIHD